MRRALLALTIAAGLASAPASAHEGHEHKVMGTVCVAHVNSLEVRATSGKLHAVTVTENTKVVKGRTVLKASDIRPGYRVVVTATERKQKDGTTTLIASRIQVGLAPPATETCAPE